MCIFNYRARGDERCKRCVSEARRKEKLIQSWKCKTPVPGSPVQTPFSRRFLRVPVKKKKILGRTDNVTPTLLTTLEAYSRAALVRDTKAYTDLGTHSSRMRKTYHLLSWGASPPSSILSPPGWGGGSCHQQYQGRSQSFGPANKIPESPWLLFVWFRGEHVTQPSHRAKKTEF